MAARQWVKGALKFREKTANINKYPSAPWVRCRNMCLQALCDWNKWEWERGLALLEFGAVKAQRRTSRNTWTRQGRCYVLLAAAQSLAGECRDSAFWVALKALCGLAARAARVKTPSLLCDISWSSIQCMFQMRPLHYQLMHSASPIVENMQLLLKRGHSDCENTFSHNL